MGDFVNEKYLEKYKNLGLNICFYRRRKDYTQMEFAEIIDVNTTHISRIELGKGAASLDVLFRIAEVLEVPIQKLFDVKD